MRLLSPAGDLAALAELSDEDLESLYAPPPRRHLRAGFVSSLDGAIEVDGRSGALGGDDDLRVFVTLRAVCDVILVGSGTAVAEDYGPARLSDARRQRRLARGQGAVPPIAVVNAAASLDPHGRLFATDDAGSPRPIVLCAASATGAPRQALSEVADIVECGDEHVDLGEALDALAQRGLSRVLCEGGPTLTRSLADAHLLDELCLSQAMVLAGPGHQTLFGGSPSDATTSVHLGHLLLGDGVVLGRWELAR